MTTHPNTPADFPLTTEILAHGEIDGIPWVASRAPIYGAVNGYARVPDNHPWLTATDEWDIDNTVPWGEITYREGNWVGFDTLHAGQHWPGMPIGPFDGDIVITENMVIAWAELLARDAAEATP